MALSDKINLIVKKYVRRSLPSLETDALPLYIQDELRLIEATLRSLSDSSLQVTDRPPEAPRKGMVRYAVSPWNPLSNGFSGLVVYNGSAWVAV
jgi:hypothetical protein